LTGFGRGTLLPCEWRRKAGAWVAYARNRGCCRVLHGRVAPGRVDVEHRVRVLRKIRHFHFLSRAREKKNAWELSERKSELYIINPCLETCSFECISWLNSSS
jgi:hypothetical protein